MTIHAVKAHHAQIDLNKKSSAKKNTFENLK